MKKVEKILIMLLSIVMVSPIIFLVLDLGNITHIARNITTKYDWLSFMGSYFSSISTLILGIITIFITEKYGEQNTKTAIDDLKANCYSDIIIRDEQEFEKIVKEGDYFYYYKFKFADKNKRPLSKIRIKKVLIREHDSGKMLFEQECNYKIDLEYTPENRRDIATTYEEFYFARIKLDKQIEEILKSKEKFLKVEIDAEISNVFNVVISRKFILVVKEIINDSINIPNMIKTRRFHDFSINPKIYYDEDFNI